MSNPVDVQWFTSAMNGAPSLSGTAGTMIAVWDACLINGFGSVTLDSLVVSGAVATATKSSHGFLDHTVVLIDGATPGGLNGKKRITRTGANTFTFDATGIADQTATGTITAKMAPVGWTKPYSGTNKAVYARASGATAMLLRIDDSPAQYPTLIMYETMSNVDTGTGPTPASGSQYFCKSTLADGTARDWRLFADGRKLYFFGKDNGTYWYAAMDYGDIVPYKSSDAYHALLHAHPTAVYNHTYYNYSPWGALARSYTQSGGTVAAKVHSHSINSALCQNFQAYPAPADNAFQAWPIEVWENSVTVARGLMPGQYNPIHTYPDAGGPPDGLIVTSIPQLSGRKLMVQALYNSGSACAIDITGPWR